MCRKAKNYSRTDFGSTNICRRVEEPARGIRAHAALIAFVYRGSECSPLSKSPVDELKDRNKIALLVVLPPAAAFAAST
jgi:hypothetical protein